MKRWAFVLRRIKYQLQLWAGVTLGAFFPNQRRVHFGKAAPFLCISLCFSSGTKQLLLHSSFIKIQGKCTIWFTESWFTIARHKSSLWCYVGEKYFWNVILRPKVWDCHIYHTYPLPHMMSLVISELGGIFCSFFYQIQLLDIHPKNWFLSVQESV